MKQIVQKNVSSMCIFFHDRLVQYVKKQICVFQMKDALEHALALGMFVINAVRSIKGYTVIEMVGYSFCICNYPNNMFRFN